MLNTGPNSTTTILTVHTISRDQGIWWVESYFLTKINSMQTTRLHWITPSSAASFLATPSRENLLTFFCFTVRSRSLIFDLPKSNGSLNRKMITKINRWGYQLFYDSSLRSSAHGRLAHVSTREIIKQRLQLYSFSLAKKNHRRPQENWFLNKKNKPYVFRLRVCCHSCSQPTKKIPPRCLFGRANISSCALPLWQIPPPSCHMILVSFHCPFFAGPWHHLSTPPYLQILSSCFTLLVASWATQAGRGERRAERISGAKRRGGPRGEAGRGVRLAEGRGVPRGEAGRRERRAEERCRGASCHWPHWGRQAMGQGHSRVARRYAVWHCSGSWLNWDLGPWAQHGAGGGGAARHNATRRHQLQAC